MAAPPQPSVVDAFQHQHRLQREVSLDEHGPEIACNNLESGRAAPRFALGKALGRERDAGKGQFPHIAGLQGRA